MKTYTEEEVQLIVQETKSETMLMIADLLEGRDLEGVKIMVLAMRVAVLGVSEGAGSVDEAKDLIKEKLGVDLKAFE